MLIQTSSELYWSFSLWYILLDVHTTVSGYFSLACPPSTHVGSLDIGEIRTIAYRTAALSVNWSLPTPAVRSVKTLAPLALNENPYFLIPGTGLLLTCSDVDHLRCWDVRLCSLVATYHRDGVRLTLGKIPFVDKVGKCYVGILDHSLCVRFQIEPFCLRRSPSSTLTVVFLDPKDVKSGFHIIFAVPFETNIPVQPDDRSAINVIIQDHKCVVCIQPRNGKKLEYGAVDIVPQLSVQPLVLKRVTLPFVILVSTSTIRESRLSFLSIFLQNWVTMFITRDLFFAIVDCHSSPWLRYISLPISMDKEGEASAPIEMRPFIDELELQNLAWVQPIHLASPNHPLYSVITYEERARLHLIPIMVEDKQRLVAAPTAGSPIPLTQKTRSSTTLGFPGHACLSAVFKNGDQGEKALELYRYHHHDDSWSLHDIEIPSGYRMGDGMDAILDERMGFIALNKVSEDKTRDCIDVLSYVL